MQQNGLDEKKLIKTIYNLKLSNEVINFCVKKNIEKNSFLFLSKKKIFINKEFFCQPYEVVFRGLADLLKLVGEKYYPVRGKKLDNIITNLRDNKLTKVTLGNCLIEKVSETVIISKER